MVSANDPAVDEKRGDTTQDNWPKKLRSLSRWVLPLAVLVYLSFATLLGVNRVGLHYDEAIIQHGAVHVLNFTGKPSFAFPEGGWVFFAGRYWPLAIIPYAGAVKDYLLLLPFALFGPSAEVVRVLNAVLGALGIWGIATLLKREINLAVAAAVAFILASHPAYIDQTIFDYGVVVVWMALLGLIALAISNYLRRPSVPTAFLIGLWIGIGVWNRANFIWFLVSALIAMAFAFRRRLLIPIWHMASMAGGALLGVFPMLLFQIKARLVILGFIRYAQQKQSFSYLLRRRLHMLSEIFISDSEQRRIWMGPLVPNWQIYFFCVVVLLAIIACFSFNKGESQKIIAWRRASAITLLIFTAIMLTSNLPVTYHHLVMLIPIAAVVVVLGFQGLVHRWKKAAVLAIATGLVYVGAAFYWNVTAARGLRKTGGVNEWSDAIYLINDYLLTNHKGERVTILDWGLQNNLYVLSNSRIDSREAFWGATIQVDQARTRWDVHVSRGGLFLTNSPGNRHFPEATEGFLTALVASGRKFNRTEFRQKLGMGYAELYYIPPLEK